MSNVEQWEHNEQRAMETEITTLREQVEKLTKERDDLLGYKKYWKEWLNLQSGDARQIAERAEYADALEQQLAALTEQNEKMKDALKTVVDDAEECTDHDDWTARLLSLDAYHIASTCIEEINELPDQWSDMSEVAEQRAATNCAEAIRARMRP